MAKAKIHVTKAGFRTPCVAIVGRPNVGKSTLFNRIISSRKAIVHDFPGVTRDRIFSMAWWDGLDFYLIDTGGFNPDAKEGIWAEMKEQVELAIEEADAVIVLMDGREGLTPLDETVIQYLRENSRKPLLHVVNKIDSEQVEGNITEFHNAGIDKLFGVSAEHGRDIAELLDALVESLPRPPKVEVNEGEGEGDETAGQESITRVAIVGRPNVGKSTMINRLVGRQRLVTDDVPGTTRDAVDIELEIGGRKYVFVDTAGMRRKSRVVEAIEKFSIIKALKAAENCDVAVLMLDATQESVTDQDARVAAWIHDRGRGIVIAINKWDAIEKDHKTALKYEKDVRENLMHVSYAEIMTLSALNGQRVPKLIEHINACKEQHSRRIPTAELNKTLALAWEKHPPPAKRKARNKLFYATQHSTKPPAFSLFISRPKDIKLPYRRYLINFLRETYGFTGTPIRIFLKERSGRNK